MLHEAFYFLLATVLAVPIARKLGLGSVLGYLIAGALIGPHALGLIRRSGADVMHVAEFGVVMMLFLIGLELHPAKLWQLRIPLLGMGGIQVALTTLVLGGVAVWTGLGWKAALAVGFMLSLSSTAIVLQSLKEKGVLATSGGQSSFSVLLFQDIAVIPFIALLPWLGSGASVGAAGAGTSHWVGAPAWLRWVEVAGAIGMMILLPRYLLRPMFRWVAESHVHEVFTAMTLLIVVGVYLLMERIGVSPALGAFLAGVILAGSSYQHQLEADLEPFKALLLGLFFVGVGASIDFARMADHPGRILVMVLGLVLLKGLVLLGVAWLFGIRGGAAWLFTVALAQGGEFAFVLLKYAMGVGAVTNDQLQMLTAVVALSMGLTPFLLAINDRWIQPRFAEKSIDRAADQVDESNPVIVAGFGRFGHVVGRLLRANGVGTTVLDIDAEQIETLGQFGLKAYFGDATRLKILEKAGIGGARLLVVAIDDERRSVELVDTVRRHYPGVEIMVRAENRIHAYEFVRRNIRFIHRVTFGSSLAMAKDALIFMGKSPESAARAVESFRSHDESAVRDMARIKVGTDEYFSRGRLHIRNLEESIRSDPVNADPKV